MPSVVLYFQVHQPHRLRRYSVFDTDPNYFDDSKNAEICRKVASRCYLPATRLLLDLVKRFDGALRLSYSITGTALEQFEAFAPEVLDVFRELARTGCCEFLGETYHHSLAFVHSREEFREQVDLHARRIQHHFGQTPAVFRNTELIYSNALAYELSIMTDAAGRRRWLGALCEGTDVHLGNRKPSSVYKPPKHDGHDLLGRDNKPLALLLKNHRFSDDIAFRFSNRGWGDWPLTPEKFAGWIAAQGGDVCNLFMDYETFGEHQWAETGIFSFLTGLPDKVLASGGSFLTPTEALTRFAPSGEFDIPAFTSWADTERDLSAWNGNAMQANALDEVFSLEKPLKDKVARLVKEARGAGPNAPATRRLEAAAHLLEDWRRLTTSDHFYYMSTKYFSDGDVHKYFNPYDSPYDSYINYMNVLDNVRSRLAL
ncbi:MAG TPA: glycoside hydrolase family 57 protein [Phycisphaerales bacterium]